MSTPASSHLLGPLFPAAPGAAVFSIKQTAVPAGLLVAGILGPWLTGLTGWRGALLIAAASAWSSLPCSNRCAANSIPTACRPNPFACRISHTTILSVMARADLRRLSFACFAFNGLQTVFTSYFVVALVELGHGLVAAGFVFSVAMVIAVRGAFSGAGSAAGGSIRWW